MNARTLQARAIPLVSGHRQFHVASQKQVCKAAPRVTKPRQRLQGKAEPAAAQPVVAKPTFVSRVRDFCSSTLGKYAAAVALAAMLVRSAATLSQNLPLLRGARMCGIRHVSASRRHSSTTHVSHHPCMAFAYDMMAL